MRTRNVPRTGNVHVERVACEARRTLNVRMRWVGYVTRMYAGRTWDVHLKEYDARDRRQIIGFIFMHVVRRSFHARVI